MPGRRHSQRIAGAIRAMDVMSSSLTDAMVSQWILWHCRLHVLSAIRREAIARLKIAEQHLGTTAVCGAQGAFIFG